MFIGPSSGLTAPSGAEREPTPDAHCAALERISSDAKSYKHYAPPEHRHLKRTTVKLPLEVVLNVFSARVAACARLA